MSRLRLVRIDVSGAAGEALLDLAEELAGELQVSGLAWERPLLCEAEDGVTLLAGLDPRAPAGWRGWEGLDGTWERARRLGLSIAVVDLQPGRAADDDGELVLYSDPWVRSPPLWAWGRHPASLLDLPAPLRRDLVQWAWTVQALERVWLASGSLEQAAWRELCDPASATMREGAALVRRVAEAAGRSAWLYLRGERDRCPACGGPWQRPAGEGWRVGVAGCAGCGVVGQGPDLPG